MTVGHEETSSSSQRLLFPEESEQNDGITPAKLPVIPERPFTIDYFNTQFKIVKYSLPKISNIFSETSPFETIYSSNPSNPTNSHFRR